jgi:predicted RNA-binding protein YlqC (UPF0109 family)
MASIEQTEQLVRYLITSLVESPDAVEIKTTEGEDSVTFEVALDSEDVGKVIGRQGRIIKAIRTIARAAGSTDSRQVEVEVLG